LSVDPTTLERLALTIEEYERIVKLSGKEPTALALSIFGALWSEHCAYKHSKPLLRQYFDLFTTAGVRAQIHENAGAVRIDDDNWVVMKMESHNHPSAVEPYQGSATGIGGIVRDILTLGARPIALLNSLRFGGLHDRQDRRLFAGVVAGISDYGNCLGIPDVGGEIIFDQAYAGTPLVNVMCVGLFKQSQSKLNWITRYPQTENLLKPFSSRPLPPLKQRPTGGVLILFGAATGRDGIQGATFASATLTDTTVERRSAVQIGDAFKEKLLIEACLDLSRLECVEGLQDLGAAGLAGAAIEYASRRGVGVDIDISAVPRREVGMAPDEVMVSESQERMLVAVTEGCEADVEKVLEKWELDYSCVGRLIPRRNKKAYEAIIRDGVNGKVLERIKLPAINDPLMQRLSGEPSDEIQELRDFDLSQTSLPAESLNNVLLTVIASPNIASKESVHRQYDTQVQTNTVLGPGGDAAVLRLRGTGKGLALTTDGNGRYCYLDPYRGGQIAVAEACRNLVCAGAKPIAITDCLNFGNRRQRIGRPKMIRVRYPLVNQPFHDGPGQVFQYQRHQRADGHHFDRGFGDPRQVEKRPGILIPALGQQRIPGSISLAVELGRS